MTKIFKQAFPAIIIFLLVTAVAPSPVAAEDLTATQVLDNIFKRFSEQNIHTMMYEEIRTVSSKMNTTGAQNGMMMLNRDNATTYVMRYFYQSPDKHGYRFLSESIKNFWPGNPGQENSIAMDERWLQRVKERYKISLTPNRKYKGRMCYVLQLTPRPGYQWNFPMSWYVDKEKFLILSLTHVVRKSPRNASVTTGEISYDRVHGYLVPVKAHWVTTVTQMPYKFEFHVRYENYIFNAPLDQSVFKQEPIPEKAR